MATHPATLRSDRPSAKLHSRDVAHVLASLKVQEQVAAEEETLDARGGSRRIEILLTAMTWVGCGLVLAATAWLMMLAWEGITATRGV